jgi:pimeloyl-ACP methyl ester carboxylesterase
VRVDVNGVGIEYEVTGDGPPVVLLHGFPDSGRLWRHQVPALAEAGFKVIVPDMRGYGRSDKPTEVEAYTMDLPPRAFCSPAWSRHRYKPRRWACGAQRTPRSPRVR